ncbi:hypothetical protein [Leptospira noguchii]|uniref:hypothetical protein n=1 Tax=Leptospira noguchii TaxID=28182 RepID=UPI000560F502|nr:hypothetical protein [Leptospira noguchii]
MERKFIVSKITDYAVEHGIVYYDSRKNSWVVEGVFSNKNNGSYIRSISSRLAKKLIIWQIECGLIKDVDLDVNSLFPCPLLDSGFYN